MKVLVAGATGQTGARVVRRLLARGDSVRVLSRNANRARESLGPDVEIHKGDVRDLSSLEDLARGVDVAVITTGTRSYFGANGGAAVDGLGNRNLAQALNTVNQIVLLSAFGLDRRSVFLSAFSVALNNYFHWKREAEEAFRASGVSTTMVRPVELRNREPRGDALLNQEEPLSLLRTVSRDLVAEVLVGCCGHPDALNKTFELCEGPLKGALLGPKLARLHLDHERPLPTRSPLLTIR